MFLDKIYQILGLSAEAQKKLNEDLESIINDNLFADLIESLNETELDELKNKVSGAEDKIGEVKKWFEEHNKDESTQQKAKDSVVKSVSEFISVLTDEASPEQHKQIFTYMEEVKNE